MLDAIIVIAQYARDQAVASARDQAARVSPRRMDQWLSLNSQQFFFFFFFFCFTKFFNGKVQ